MVLTLALYTAGVLVVVGIVLYVVGAYNQVAAFARDADRAFANVDVSLQQRHDEIPALVETCRAFMAHEKDVLERVTQLRSRVNGTVGTGDVDARVITENGITEILSRLFVLAEGYPELKSSDLFANIHRRLTEVENEIADRRELFNASVTAYNTLIERFPALVLARVFGWRPRPTLSLPISA